MDVRSFRDLGSDERDRLYGFIVERHGTVFFASRAEMESHYGGLVFNRGERCACRRVPDGVPDSGVAPRLAFRPGNIEGSQGAAGIPCPSGGIPRRRAGGDTGTVDPIGSGLDRHPGGAAGPAGEGLGREGLARALATLRAAGAGEIRLIVVDENHQAYNLYASSGFVQERIDGASDTAPHDRAGPGRAGDLDKPGLEECRGEAQVGPGIDDVLIRHHWVPFADPVWGAIGASGSRRQQPQA